MRITHFSIKDFRGIALRAEDVPEHGALVVGKNGAGKTSVLSALAAALTGDGANADAVRLDAERAEILVDLEGYQVRRVIKRDGATTVSVVTADGDKKAKPAAWLRERFGSIDPLRLLAAKPAERRAMILSALPVTVSREQLDAWAPGLPKAFAVDGHGIDVLDRAREHFYDARKAANVAATVAKEKADRAKASIPPNVAQDAPPLSEAIAAHDRAKAERDAIRAQQTAAKAAAARTEQARARVASLRSKADEIASGDARPAQAECEKARVNVESCDRAIAQLEQQLRDARSRRIDAVAYEDAITAAVRASDAARAESAALRAQADELAATLDAAVSHVSDEDVEAADIAETEARWRVEGARAREAHRRASATAEEAAASAALLAEQAAALDVIVRRLSTEAPAALLASAEGAQGLAIDGDTIRLDGVSLDALCGQEQMALALRIAKRLSAARVLLVDGLEALDPEQRDAFVAEACADGWQLIGTLVDRGEVRFVAIDAAEKAEAAQ